MLGKLYKHEFKYLYRIMLPIFAIILGLAGLNRLLFFVNIDHYLFGSIQAMTAIISVLAILAMFVIAYVVIIMRFYKHLLSHEGYLTFSLPITATQHIICKIVAAFTVIIASFLTIIGGLLIIGAGTNTMAAIFDELGWLFGLIKEYINKDVVIIGIELIVLMVVSLFNGIMAFYTAMAIGQQFKSRVGGAVLSYFAIYAAGQVLNTLLLFPISFLINSSVTALDSSISNIQILIGYFIVIYLIYAAAYFLITRFLLTKRLNLE